MKIKMYNIERKSHLARIFIDLWQHRNLIYQLTKRDILTKYRGSFAGLLWLLFSPLLMLGLYTVVLGVFMHSK
ncbi:MAG: hypothetical protein NTW08_00295 [Gammaproteobacteria bacterium]|nr:hypothetical protein [Gammaproteobacteria bacterium]